MKNKRIRKQDDEKEINLRKLYLLSYINNEPEKIYRLYKYLEYVKYRFNLYNDDLEADRYYIRGDHIVYDHYKLNTT